MRKNNFTESKWIWRKGGLSENDYTEFSDGFLYKQGQAIIRISICGDYTLYVNGKFVESNQYPDFEHYKIYDEINITDYVHQGNNIISIIGWYFGTSGMRFCTPRQGLIYEVICDGSVAAYSCEKTLSRNSLTYKSGNFRKISLQFGYSFSYDSTHEDNWINGELTDFEPSVTIEHTYNLNIRPNQKLHLKKAVYGESYKTENSYIIDLGKEYVGLATLNFTTEEAQNITVCYSEILVNGHTKRYTNPNDFSFDYVAHKGQNNYTNYMFRLACRYIEIYSEHPIDIHKIGIIPQYYPVKRKNIELSNALDRSIYDICMNTLELCMMEHYVDCPWREQCLYAYDSRNQILSGYVSFEGGNYKYARSNLLLMSKDKREDGLLSICFPSAEDLTIPCFSLYYILAVKEYLDYTGDLSLGKEVFSKLESILMVFKNNIKNGLVYQFSGKNRWNFYDWSPYAETNLFIENNGVDFLMNAIFVIALKSFDHICGKLNKPNQYKELIPQISEAAKNKFFNADMGLFFVQNIEETPTELANSLAILSGIAEGDIAKNICKAMCSGTMIECSLSMKTLKYDAMLSVNKEKYKDIILDEIRKTYKIMLDADSSTVWETIDGGDAFSGAGSLCHGWSAIPVYYYALFENL